MQAAIYVLLDCLQNSNLQWNYHKYSSTFAGGEEAQCYCSLPCILLHNTHVNCFAPVDRNGQRFLLADLAGNLYMMLLEVKSIEPEEDSLDVKVKDMKVFFNALRQ